MRSRWLSTFSLLGILLIILGIVGAVVGHRFVYDPGQVPDGHEAWYYLTVGVLMLLNGLIPPALSAQEKRDAARTAPVGKTEARPAIAAAVENGDNA